MCKEDIKFVDHLLLHHSAAWDIYYLVLGFCLLVVYGVSNLIGHVTSTRCDTAVVVSSGLGVNI